MLTEVSISGGDREYVTWALIHEGFPESFIRLKQARSFRLPIMFYTGLPRETPLPSGQMIPYVGKANFYWVGEKSAQFEHRSQIECFVVDDEGLDAPLVLGRPHQLSRLQGTLTSKEGSKREATKTSPPLAPTPSRRAKTPAQRPRRERGKGS